VVFYLNEMKTLKNIKIILNWFRGLKVNFNKSLLIGINVDLKFTKRVINIFEIKSICLPVNYLVLSLARSKSKTM
jgi:hypothetical protein